MNNLKAALTRTSNPLSLDSCENVLVYNEKRYEIQELVVSHLFVLGSNTNNSESKIIFKIPLPHQMPYIILQYAAKPLNNSIDVSANNRFWITTPGEKRIFPFGGENGHELTPYRGRFFDIKSPSVYSGELAAVFKVHPANSTGSLERARVKLLLNIAFLKEIL
jgi:hypothetical protein